MVFSFEIKTYKCFFFNTPSPKKQFRRSYVLKIVLVCTSYLKVGRISLYNQKRLKMKIETLLMPSLKFQKSTEKKTPNT